MAADIEAGSGEEAGESDQRGVGPNPDVNDAVLEGGTQIGLVQFARRDILAIEAVLDVAYNARLRPVRASALAKRNGIRARYLEHTLQQLARGGILKGVRGPQGGYVLARERRKVSVGDILRVLRRERPNTKGTVTDTCSEFGRAGLSLLWNEVADSVRARLDRVTLEDLCEQVQRSGIKPEGTGVQDFTI